jgi:hypothetical protein
VAEPLLTFTPQFSLKPKWLTIFWRSDTQTFSDGVSTEAVTSHLRTLHGFLGPKFRTGPGPFRVSLQGRLDSRISASPIRMLAQALRTPWALQLAARSSQSVRAGGFEALAGPIGVRAEIGDDIYFVNRSHNNMRIGLGAQFRF